MGKKGCETVKEVTEVPNKKNNYCTSGLHLNTQRHLDPFGPWDPSPARTFLVILYKSETTFFIPSDKDDKKENKITKPMIQSSQLPLFPALRRGLSHAHMDPVLRPIECEHCGLFFFVTFQH